MAKPQQPDPKEEVRVEVGEPEPSASVKAAAAAYQDSEEVQEAAKEAQEQQAVPQEEEKEVQAGEKAVSESERDLQEKILRAHAEMDNIRKRAAKDVEDARAYAVTAFAKDLVDVLDNLYRASESVPADLLEENEEIKPLFEGVEMTRRSMVSAFERHGLSRVEPEKGDAFDHHLHQAVSQATEEGVGKGAIIQVIQAGYQLKGRLLRPAMVVVQA